MAKPKGKDRVGWSLAGSLLVFEGPDDVGKTTLSTLLENHLRTLGLDAVRVAFPGDRPGTLGKQIYDLHHDPTRYGIDSVGPTSLQLLHIAAHIDNIEREILPAIGLGKIVILDRFWWSTLVYGSLGGGNLRTLRDLVAIEKRHWARVRPRLAFLILRSSSGSATLPSSSVAALQQEYVRIATEESRRHPVCTVQNDDTVEAAMDQILNCLTEQGGHSIAEGHRHGLPLSETMALFEPPASTAEARAEPAVWARTAPPVPTQVFDTYWRFAAARQEVFFRRLDGKPGPWTDDPILMRYKFTNAYRASDRVSQYLIRNVIYSGDQSAAEVFFRVILFKLFNKIETWELLRERFGVPTWAEFDIHSYDTTLSSAFAAGRRIYSGAYIIPTAPSDGATRKHTTHLQLLSRMIVEGLPARLRDANTLREAFSLLRTYPMMGDFLAYQFLIDLNYSTLLNHSEADFIVPGPGARDGLRKCFHSLGGLSEADVIRLAADRQVEEFDRLGLPFRSLWGRELQLIDCQNLFCEVDKYARVAHPEAEGLTRRERIKQIFRPKEGMIQYWYPPKWGINDRITTAGEKCDASR